MTAFRKGSVLALSAGTVLVSINKHTIPQATPIITCTLFALQTRFSVIAACRGTSWTILAKANWKLSWVTAVPYVSSIGSAFNFLLRRASYLRKYEWLLTSYDVAWRHQSLSRRKFIYAGFASFWMEIFHAHFPRAFPHDRANILVRILLPGLSSFCPVTSSAFTSTLHSWHSSSALGPSLKTGGESYQRRIRVTYPGDLQKAHYPHKRHGNACSCGI